MMWALQQYKAEVWRKQKFYNDSGQEVSEWVFDRTIRCDFMPSRAEERLVGRIQNPTSFLIFTSDRLVENSDQIRNIIDRYGEEIDAGPFNVIGIRKHRGWAKVSHLTINAQKVLE
jgi:hypothetical protein